MITETHVQALHKYFKGRHPRLKFTRRKWCEGILGFGMHGHRTCLESLLVVLRQEGWTSWSLKLSKTKLLEWFYLYFLLFITLTSSWLPWFCNFQCLSLPFIARSWHSACMESWQVHNLTLDSIASHLITVSRPVHSRSCTHFVFISCSFVSYYVRMEAFKWMMRENQHLARNVPSYKVMLDEFGYGSRCEEIHQPRESNWMPFQVMQGII